MTTYEILATPTHEGGHIAAAWLLWGDDGIVGPVTIVETAFAMGSATVGAPTPTVEDLNEAWHASLTGQQMAPHVRYWAETTIQMYQAGRLAVAVAASVHHAFELPPDGPDPRQSPERLAKREAALAAGEEPDPTDTESVKQILRLIIADPAEAEAYSAWIRYRTIALCDNPLFEAIVAALVPELLEHRTLEPDAVLALIHGVTRPKSGAQVAAEALED